MSTSRTTNILLVVVALLLAANLLQPLAAPGTAWADDKAPAKTELAAAGNAAWILKGEQIYYVTFEADFEAIKVYRPEKLDR
jgi:hypothetical protein